MFKQFTAPSGNDVQQLKSYVKPLDYKSLPTSYKLADANNDNISTIAAVLQMNDEYWDIPEQDRRLICDVVSLGSKACKQSIIHVLSHLK